MGAAERKACRRRGVGEFRGVQRRTMARAKRKQSELSAVSWGNRQTQKIAPRRSFTPATFVQDESKKDSPFLSS
jgi:hypothetical protein